MLLIGHLAFLPHSLVVICYIYQILSEQYFIFKKNNNHETVVLCQSKIHIQSFVENRGLYLEHMQ